MSGFAATSYRVIDSSEECKMQTVHVLELHMVHGGQAWQQQGTMEAPITSPLACP